MSDAGEDAPEHHDRPREFSEEADAPPRAACGPAAPPRACTRPRPGCEASPERAQARIAERPRPAYRGRLGAKQLVVTGEAMRTATRSLLGESSKIAAEKRVRIRLRWTAFANHNESQVAAMSTKTGPGARPELDERGRRVLSAVVRDHIEGGEPVGSLAVQKRADLDVSSATVRAVMADLEVLGYLEKPHTSAGRIPTGLGYRYYVDTLLRVQAPSAEERQLIEKSTQEAVSEVDGLLAGTTRLLRGLTHHAAAISAPRAQGQRFERIEFVPLREGRVLAVLVTRSGSVQNRLLAPAPGERPLTHSQLEESGALPQLCSSAI